MRTERLSQSAIAGLWPRRCIGSVFKFRTNIGKMLAVANVQTKAALAGWSTFCGLLALVVVRGYLYALISKIES